MLKKSPKHYAKRSGTQNNAIHLLYGMYAEALNNAGLYMQKVLKSNVDIDWSKDTFKEYVWRPVQEAQFQKKSTTELTTKELQEVYETINRYFGEKHGLHVPFPSIEQLINNYD